MVGKAQKKNPTVNKVRKKIKKRKKFVHEEKEEKIDSFFSFFSQVKDMIFLSDEVTFFKEDFFVNQLEYYLDIVSKTKIDGLNDDDDDAHGEMMEMELMVKRIIKAAIKLKYIYFYFKSKF